MKMQNGKSRAIKTKFRPLFLAVNTVFTGLVLSQVPMIAQTSYAAQAAKPAGAGVAVIAVTTASTSTTADLIKSANALKAKGYEVKFALPSDAASSAAISQAASSGGFGTISGSAQQIAASLPSAVAYGDKAAVNIAAQLQGQKADASGAYDLNGKVTAVANASSASILSNTNNSMAALTGSVADPLLSPVEQAFSDSDILLAKQLELAGVDPTVAVMPFPTQLDRSANRYGQYRSSDRFHAGWDLTTPGSQKLPLTWMGMASDVRATSAGGNSVYVTRLNGDKYYYFHMKSPVGKCIGKSNWPKSVGDPSFCGVVGNTATKKGSVVDSGDIHLHMGYAVAPRDYDKRRRQTWMPSAGNARSAFSGGQKLSDIGLHSDGVGAAYNSDITPYMSHDMVVKNDYASKWLGSTMRQQFNALYGTRLPTGADSPQNMWPGAKYDRGATKILSSELKPITNVPRWGNYEWTPDQVAAARSGTIKGMYSGAFPDGLYMASPQMIASFLSESDGLGFGTLPTLAESADITAQSPREMIKNISSQRYGNDEWHQAMMKLSSKAMMSEYVAMTAAENFIDQQNSIVYQRIEGLMAGLIQARSASLQGRIEAIQEVAIADIVPDLINTKVEQQEYQYSGGGGGMGGGIDIDLSTLPSDVRELTLLLFQALSVGESNGDYNAYNTGTKNGNSTMRSCYSDKAGCRVPTQMTVGEILTSSRLPSTNLHRIFAVGKYQLITSTLTDAVSRGAISRSTVFTPEAQDKLIDSYFLSKKVRVLGSFVKGSGGYTVDDAQYAMGKEWAAIGIPSGKTNKYGTTSSGFLSYYSQAGVNSSHKKTTSLLRGILTKIYAVNNGIAPAPAAPASNP